MITVCHFTSVHPRYDPRIFLKQCSSLAKKYNTVLIVADGLGNETRNNIKIIDVGKNNRGRISRILFTSYKVYKAALKIRADIYEFHDPELLPFGWLLKNKNKKVIFDMHEDTAGQLLLRDWVPTLLKTTLSLLYASIEKVILRKMDLIFVPQQFMEEKYRSINKIVTIHNYPLTNFYPDISFKKQVKGLLYVGSISKPRGILNMLNMLTHVNTSLTLVGKFTDDLLAKNAKKHPAWHKVTYLGELPYEEVKKIYSENLVGLIPFENIGQYRHTHVIKVFEYMAYGLPIIMPNFGGWPNFNKRYNVGLTTNTEEPEQFARVVETILESSVDLYSKNGRKFVKQEFLWDSVEKHLFDSYEKLF